LGGVSHQRSAASDAKDRLSLMTAHWLPTPWLGLVREERET